MTLNGMAHLTSMELDLDLMERTEKLVADMLKSAMVDNSNHHKLPDGMTIDEGRIFINGTGENLKEKHEKTFQDPNKIFICEETVEVSEELQIEDSDNININSSQLESFIVDELHKIRMEYPMYPDANNSRVFCNLDDGPTPIMAACPNANMGSPYSHWYQPNQSSHAESWPITQYNCDSNASDSQYWNDAECSRNESNVSLKWSYSNQSINATIPNGEETDADSSSDVFEGQMPSDEENVTVVDSTTLETHDGVNCNGENSDPSTNGNENSNCASDGPIAAAIHAEQTTTTTTTTSAGFSLLHQQTSSSCTTTNFIPNGLANAVLANSTAALYAQSILNSTAHQYLSVFRKEVQQYLTSINYSAMSIPNLNLGFYERLFLAQLLQQQIVYQQQIAFAALIQQQKLAAQYATNIAASPTFPPSNSNVNVFGASVSPSRSGLNNLNNLNNTFNGYSAQAAKVNTSDLQAIITEEYLGTTHKSNSE